MHLTLHLTNNCNFRCSYCYQPHSNDDMTFETASRAILLAMEDSQRKNPDGTLGVIFFGGEPLICRDLIKEIMAFCHRTSLETGQSFHYKITTNGSLLDEEFLVAPDTSEIFIALSHDGIRAAHDLYRLDRSGQGTFDRIHSTIKLLLKYKPYSPVMMVTSPGTVAYYAESVKYLFECGFRYLICSLNYGSVWSDDDLGELKRQYQLIASWYEKLTDREEKFYFSPFEVKIASHIFPGSCWSERCELGQRQISVAPNGRLFPCVQFVGDGSDSEFCIGDVGSGIDESRRKALFNANDSEKESCRECAIRERCNHYCGCLNRQSTGSIREVSPTLCAHERIVLPIADRLAETLFKKRNALFIQKQYNELFPLISLAEDRSQSMHTRN